MSRHLDAFLHRLALEPAILVRVAAAQGSVPREVGAWMAVFSQGEIGTIGGGQLEWRALHEAREALIGRITAPWEKTVVLGPSLGQCCGGRMVLRFEPVWPEQAPEIRQHLSSPAIPVALFGGGHVGRSIVQALAPLPYAVHWIDSRDQPFPDDVPAQVQTEHSDPVESAVADLLPGAHVLIMSFSHAEDLDIVAACLRRQRERDDLRFVGLIGSGTKWASFGRRLRQQGFSDRDLAAVTCPIGLPGITGKAPEVIAASLVAQLLLFDSQHPLAPASEEAGPC